MSVQGALQLPCVLWICNDSHMTVSVGEMFQNKTFKYQVSNMDTLENKAFVKNFYFNLQYFLHIYLLRLLDGTTCRTRDFPKSLLFIQK